jgi:hypothetical protein
VANFPRGSRAFDLRTPLVIAPADFLLKAFWHQPAIKTRYPSALFIFSKLPL